MDVVVHWSMVMVATITASVRQHRKDAPVAKADDVVRIDSPLNSKADVSQPC